MPHIRGDYCKLCATHLLNSTTDGNRLQQSATPKITVKNDFLRIFVVNLNNSPSNDFQT